MNVALGYFTYAPLMQALSGDNLLDEAILDAQSEVLSRIFMGMNN